MICNATSTPCWSVSSRWGCPAIGTSTLRSGWRSSISPSPSLERNAAEVGPQCWHLDVPAVEIFSAMIFPCDGIAGAFRKYHFAIGLESRKSRALLGVPFKMLQ